MCNKLSEMFAVLLLLFMYVCVFVCVCVSVRLGITKLRAVFTKDYRS